MPNPGEHIWNSIQLAHRSGRCLVMGIVNVTPDSFSDGGAFHQTERAVEHSLRLADEGADIIDIGGESTRPGAEEVDAEIECERVIPVVEQVRKQSDIPISVDTRKATVAREACSAGAGLVNDVSAMLHDPEMTDTIKNCDVPVVLMHMQGTPETMQKSPEYKDVVSDVSAFLSERVAYAQKHGIGRIIADPGIGFGKRLEHNLALLARLTALRKLGVPLMIGVSRKRFIGDITGREAGDRLGGSIAAALYSILQGASIVRVHDVHDTVAAVQVLHAVTQTGVSAHVV